MPTNAEIRKLIKRSRKSSSYFIEKFCKIKHPSIGTIDFQLFDYQVNCLREFRNNRFNIFKKCRQCGISTLTGSYALWFAMMYPDKTILIVSKRDEDAKDYLSKNVKYPYENLPQWMKDIWKPTSYTEHKVEFSNGSSIKSLTSSPDTLRSNASSLNILDEAAFMDNMETMWSGGWSTMQHGGHAIVISTTNGISNWYWEQWEGAINQTNVFNPIQINWWDMDWELEYTDPITKQKMRIAPTDGIRECTTKAEIEKWGKYYSPWLEGEYRALASKGESHKFRQEILGEFVGGGGTILEPSLLTYLAKESLNYPQPQVVDEPLQYVNQLTQESKIIDIVPKEEGEGLYIWKTPVLPDGAGWNSANPGHTYVIGVDVATGQNKDYSVAEVFDLNTREQVAEFMMRLPIKQFAMVVDWIARWYNDALVNVERNSVGIPLIEEVIDLGYYNLVKLSKNGKAYGFATGASTKPMLNKSLVEQITDDPETGIQIYSQRLLKQLQIYVRKRTKAGRDTGQTGAQEGRGNHDDLVIGSALAFVAIPEVQDFSPTAMIPSQAKNIHIPGMSMQDQTEIAKKNVSEFMAVQNDHNLLMPTGSEDIHNIGASPNQQLMEFAKQITVGSPKPVPKVVQPKHGLNFRRK